MSEKIYDFTSDTDFTDTAKIADGELILLDNPNNVFSETFDSDAGHIYDNTKSEFVGGKNQQKDQRNYSNASFEASYNSIINGTRGLGIMTGTPIGGASITGNKLDLTGGGKCVNYDANLNADSQQTLCIKFKATPNFTGAPPTDYPFVTICKANGDSDNIIMLRLQSSGNIQIFIQDSTGAVITNSLQGVWNNVSGVEYEFGLNVDITAGATRLFVENKVSGNCEQFGATQTGTGTRDSNISFLNVGGNYNNVQFFNGYINDLVIFDSIQNTSDYAAGDYVVPDYLYATTTDLLPEMHYTGAGALVEATSFLTTFFGSARIGLDIGQSGTFTVWNGSAWVVGSDDYTDATDPATFAANIATLPVNGETYGRFKVYYTDSNVQSSFSNLEITLTAQIYSTDDPYIISNIPIDTQSIENIVESVLKSGNDDIKRVCVIANSPYYWNGSAWVTSDYSFAQSNSVAEILANIAALNTIIGLGATFLMAYIFHSENGLTTPSIATDTITYDFWAGSPDIPFKCIVYGYCYDENGEPIEDVAISIKLNTEKVLYKTDLILFDLPVIDVTTDENGYWEAELIETINMDGAKWDFTFAYSSESKEYTRGVPESSSSNFAELPF